MIRDVTPYLYIEGSCYVLIGYARKKTEALEILKTDLELMNGLAAEIRNTADEEGDFEVVAIF